jgi:predicted nuclease of predicted toxin-antitoxin system
MKLWLDAQLSPEMAIWVTQHFGIETIAIRDVGLRNAEDREIFNAAKQPDTVLITKDSDFSELIQRFGAPPRVIWLRCGNTSNERLKQIFQRQLAEAIALIEGGVALVEITDESARTV